MSHFTHMKTSFKNLFYLEKALNRLNIVTQKSSNNKLTIPQSNGYDIEFSWNGQSYELVVDMSFWEQSYPIESFMDLVSQQYAGEVIVGESEKTGFYPTRFQPNKDGSNTVILERWNNK